MSRINIYIIIIMFLVATNLATIISVVKLNKDKTEEEIPIARRPSDTRIGFLREQIGFTDIQRPDFMNYNNDFILRAGSISEKMEKLRYDLIDELATSEPDSIRLNEITEEFGSLHTELKRETINYYLNLKEIGDSNQQERLQYYFRDMLNPEGELYGRGRGTRSMNRGRGRNNRPDSIGRGLGRQQRR